MPSTTVHPPWTPNALMDRGFPPKVHESNACPTPTGVASSGSWSGAPGATRLSPFSPFSDGTARPENGPTLDSSSESPSEPSRKTVENGRETVEKRCNGHFSPVTIQPTGGGR